MPHDRNGKKIEPGSKIMIPATVITIIQSDEFCNVEVELDIPMPPYTYKTRLANLNAAQVELAKPEPEYY